jgi:hypothetical protein
LGYTKWEKGMNEKMTALAAYRAGKLSLPPGYHPEVDADSLKLKRDFGSTVATFLRNASPAVVAQAAEEEMINVRGGVSAASLHSLFG